MTGNFRDAAELLEEYKDVGLDGALLDLGVSSHQIDTMARGFSFRRGTPLNMRMGGTTGGWRTAADLLNTASEEELGKIFRDYGEERKWRGMSREIARRRRRQKPLRTADDLVAAASTALWRPLSPRDKARLFQAVQDRRERRAGSAAAMDWRSIARLLRTGGAAGRHLVPLTGRSNRERGVPGVESRRVSAHPNFPFARAVVTRWGACLTKKPMRPTRNGRGRFEPAVPQRADSEDGSRA